MVNDFFFLKRGKDLREKYKMSTRKNKMNSIRKYSNLKCFKISFSLTLCLKLFIFLFREIANTRVLKECRNIRDEFEMSCRENYVNNIRMIY